MCGCVTRGGEPSRIVFIVRIVSIVRLSLDHRHVFEVPSAAKREEEGWVISIIMS
jgi:hypothetical protein